MADCPICLAEGIKLKSNSHVIPRFLIKQTKIDGKNVAFSMESVKEGNWKDIKGDIVCSECELRFKDDDDFAKDFFDNNKYFLSRKIFPQKTPKGRRSGIEQYDPGCFTGLKKFFISVILRHHLFLKKENKDILGEHYEKLREIYMSSTIEQYVYPMCLIRYFDFSAIGYPTKESNSNSIFMIIKSFRLWMYYDSADAAADKFDQFVISDKSMNCLLVDDKGSKLMDDIFSVIEKNRKV